MRVLSFGTYERGYPRNAQIRSCLRGAGVEVVEHHVPVWEGRERAWASGLATAARLARAQAKLLQRTEGRFDVVLVGYPGHLDVTAARRAAKGAPVVFDPLVSLWDTLADDRGRFRRNSLAARLLHAIDRHALRTADLVVADTEANGDFLAWLGGIPRSQVQVCLVGAEDRLFQAGWKPSGPPVFVGKLIPLHGVETILAAAALVPDLRLRVIGSGQLDSLLEHRPDNVDWVRWVEYEQLADELRASAFALGIFGTSPKALRVIPNKAFQALACGTPLVTADTPATRELLVDGESALLVPPGDPQALADAFRRLAADAELAGRLSRGGLQCYRQQASEDVLGARWRGILEQVAR